MSVGQPPQRNLCASTSSKVAPFGFTARDIDFPAGKYTIERVGAFASVVIRDLDGRDSAYLPVIPAQDKQSDGRARLVFNKYGDQYFLAQVWTGNDRAGIQLPKSRREREVTAAGRAQHTVAVLIQ